MEELFQTLWQILGRWTNPQPTQEPVISDDEWNSADVQKLVREGFIEKIAEVTEEQA
ncbi:MAG: hypothetical protein P8X63_15150 [Desulfuromonadaceae bacterium]